MSDIIKESLIQSHPIPVSLEGTKKIIYQMENCICKIYRDDISTGTGFFTKIRFQNILLPVLITNNHILNENDIENNKIIKLTINNIVKEIIIDNSRKKYTNSKLDVTFIEIKLNEDKINENNIMEIDENILVKQKDNIELEYKGKTIYILQYPKGDLSVSYGIINNIKDRTIRHYCNTEKGSSGSPMLLLKNFKIIGIHYGSSQNKDINYGTLIKYAIDEFNNYYNKNDINLIYKGNNEEENIFGEKFVENNENNIELEIDGIKSNLISKYKLKEGDNNIKMIIKNKITNLEKMFYEWRTLKNINELKYLDTKDINNFSYLLYKCCELSDIKALENWDVSKGNNFSFMFSECSLLSDIKALQNWNVSNGNNFNGMFYNCSLLSDIKPLQNWNVSKGNNFQSEFSSCSLLSDIKALENWDVSNGNNFAYMFYRCSSLSDIKALQNWNVSNGNNFSYMFYECSKLSDIKALQNWNVSNDILLNGYSRDEERDSDASMSDEDWSNDERD